MIFTYLQVAVDDFLHIYSIYNFTGGSIYKYVQMGGGGAWGDPGVGFNEGSCTWVEEEKEF